MPQHQPPSRDSYRLDGLPSEDSKTGMPAPEPIHTGPVRGAPVASSEALAPLLSMVPGLRLMVGLVIASVVILGLYVGRDLLIPLALAALLGFLLDPAVSRLKRWGLPRMASVLLVVMVALGGIGAGALYVGSQVTELSAELPTYQNTIRQKLRNLKGYFKGPSVFDGAFKIFNTVETEIVEPEATKARNSRVQKVEIQDRPSKPAMQALSMLAKVGEPVATAGIVFLFVILILLDRSDLQDRLLRLMGRNMHMATDALDEASTRIGQYLRMQFIVNISYGIPMALGLWWIGVPGAILWGAVAAVMRFVPYIGAMVSAVFPLTLAFAVDPTWNLFLWTLGLILVLELISNNVIEPWLYGASTGLSTLSIILAATFWTALWGPIGLILSTPLTVCLLVLGRYIPALGFFEILLGSEAVFDPPQKLFRRLLGGDVDEAVEVATNRINDGLPAKPSNMDTARAVTTFYDEVAIPALKIAARNYANHSTAEHRLRLSVGTTELLQELREHYPPPSSKNRKGGAKEEGASSIAASSQRVRCVGLRSEIDVHAAFMATHALQLYGIAASQDDEALPMFPRDEHFADWGSLHTVCICSFNTQPHNKLRQLCKRIRQRWPHLRIVLVLWNADDSMLATAALEAMQADGGVSTVQELALRLQMESGNEQLIMQTVMPETPANESKRLKSLYKSGVLSPGHYEQYRDTAKQACNVFHVPWAHVAWVDADWVHTPGGLLMDGDEELADAGVARNSSLAAFIVADDEALVIEDTLRDPRFSQNPYVTEFGIRFFAGVPLRFKKTFTLGALCILDHEPREMADDDLEVLHGMAEYLMKSLGDNDGVPPAPKMSVERLEQAFEQVTLEQRPQKEPGAHAP